MSTIEESERLVRTCLDKHVGASSSEAHDALAVLVGRAWKQQINSDEDVAQAQRQAEIAVGMVLHELHEAMERFPKFASPHEGIAVIREEYLELEKEVFENRGLLISARIEAMQLAAMAVRYIVDCPVTRPDA